MEREKKECQGWEQNKSVKYINNMLRQVREIVAAMKQEQNTIQIVISAQDLDPGIFRYLT